MLSRFRRIFLAFEAFLFHNEPDFDFTSLRVISLFIFPKKKIIYFLLLKFLKSTLAEH